MSNIATQIERIETARNTIRTKLVELGLAASTDNLTDLATDISGIENIGAVSPTVMEGETYTIPKGYHNGSGTVSGVAGGGNYSLQSKSVTPTKSQQNVTPDSGYYGLSDVTVGAIPENFQDVSSVTAAAGDVLANKIIVGTDGKLITGTMPNNGTVSETLTVSKTGYTIPKGYHSGNGTVGIVTETKSATPTTSSQTISPSTGKVLSSVTVNAIPAKFADVSSVTATAANVLDNTMVALPTKDTSGNVTGHEIVEGTMPNNGAVSKSLNTTSTSYTVPMGYHSGTGSVSITLETKTATPTTSTQNITPTSGKVLSKVTVNPIPSNYITTDDADATAAQILDGKFAYVDGVKVEGTMPNMDAWNGTLDGMTATYTTIPKGYHNGNCKISLTNSIETALAAI